jgi:hypothetical protein
VTAERATATGSRPRALAELPIEALVARAEELAKEWVIALISERPLDQLGALPLEHLVRDAPRLLTQAIRAIGDDQELDSLTAAAPRSGRGQAGLAGALAVMSAASDAAATVRAAEALRGVLWNGVLLDRRWQAKGDTAIRQLSDLAERLAFVCASILAAAFEREDEGSEQVLTTAPPDPIPARGGGAVAGVGVVASRPGAVIVDEYEQPVAAPVAPVQRASEVQSEVWDGPPAGTSIDDEIAIHDTRHEEGPAAWIGSIGHQLELAQADGRPFAVLLVEPCEVEHWRAVESQTEMQRLSQELEDALALAFGVAPAGSRVGDVHERASLTRERPGRYWLLSPATDRTSAASLVERLCKAVATVVEHRGERVEVVIGTAICPEDGRTPAALAAHADVSLYAARSAARATRGPRATVHDQ